jgi:hypothetical protein
MCIHKAHVACNGCDQYTLHLMILHAPHIVQLSGRAPLQLQRLRARRGCLDLLVAPVCSAAASP